MTSYQIKGFTLIELLVVISIISLLASVILVSVQTATKKGYDSRIISDVQQLRIDAEANYDGADYDNTFIASRNNNAHGAGIIPTSGSIPKKLVDDVAANGGKIFAMTTQNNVFSYAIYGSLPSTGNTKYFCVGSDGTSKASTATVVTGNVVAMTSPICQ